MMAWLIRIFHRSAQDVPDTSSILAARRAEQHLDEADTRIRQAISSLERGDPVTARVRGTVPNRPKERST